MSLNLASLDPRQLLRLKTHRAYRKLLKGPDWDVVLADLARTNFLARSTFVPGNAGQTDHNEGRRACVLDLLKILGTEEETILKGFKIEREGATE